ncbi:MAG: PhzF family phenazine biosynthesis protein [Anaerolineaceae bacterium]|nr:PhzF family phenazine biosynthesis protein [Anaerolineaceae bacterium]
MRTYHFFTTDVFTDRAFGGNPLAVLPDARGLDTGQMQAITREFNFSETVFVLPPDSPEHTRRLRIFTPGKELPFAGHPTVGAGFVLASCGEIPLTGEVTRVIFEEGVGPVPVTIRASDGKPDFSQLTAARLPEEGPTPPPSGGIAAAFGLEASDLLGGDYAPQAFSCGVPFLFVPVQNRAVLEKIRLDRYKYDFVLGQYWAKEVFFFSFDPERPGSDLRARMFAPALGVAEDPATGSAVASLAGYLGARDATQTGTLRKVIEQGFEMGRPSILELELDKTDGQISEVRVGGASVLVTEGTLTMP